MATPLPSDIRSYVDAIVRTAEAQINAAAPKTSDPAQIATDKLETVTTYTAIREAALDFYTL